MGNNNIRMKTATVKTARVDETDEPEVVSLPPSPSQSPQLTLTERLRLLYPAVDQEETPLATAWSSQIQHYLTGLSQAAWSTLIGRGPARLSLVESFPSDACATNLMP